MTEAGALRLVASAAMLGVLGAWLLGAWLHVRLRARARSAGARRIVRFVVRGEASFIMDNLVRELSASPFFVAAITGRLESVLTAVVTAPAKPGVAARPLARIAYRIDDLGADCRLRARIEFSPLLDRFLEISSTCLFFVWPLWVFAATAGSLAWIAFDTAGSRWIGLSFALGALPLAAEVAIVARCAAIRRRLGDAVIGIADDLRTALLA